MNASEDYAQEREREAMVREQIERRGIRNPKVLDAMRTVPRHLFVPLSERHWAYSDGALRIEAGQTISQPYIVALMTELMGLQGGETVLEVGTGSGYQAAVLAQIAGQVYSIERQPALAESARQILAMLEITNVDVHVGDGTRGLPAYAPFQAITVTAAAPSVPKSLLDQLAEGGSLVIPVGGKYSQTLEVWQRQGPRYTHEAITGVAFVPLLGEEGWQESDWEKSRLW